jgi:hypothetical protein
MTEHSKQWPFTKEDDGDFSFFRELNENKVFRNKSDLQRISHDTSKELLYLSILATIALSQESNTADEAQDLASRTATFNNFDTFKVALPDLYNLSHMHFGDTSYDDLGVETQWKKNATKPLKGLYIRLLRSIGHGTMRDAEASQFLLKLERALDIDNGVYKQIRRVVSNWNRNDSKEKSSTFKRLYRYIRALSPRSEMLPIIKKQTGTVGAMTNTQKAALGVGIFGAGVLAGYKMTRNPKGKK